MKKSNTCMHFGSVCMTMELQLNRTKDPNCIAAYFSLPGRESVLGLHYPLTGGRIDIRILEDMQATVAQQIAYSLETMLGIQGVLPMV